MSGAEVRGLSDPLLGSAFVGALGSKSDQPSRIADVFIIISTSERASKNHDSIDLQVSAFLKASQTSQTSQTSQKPINSTAAPARRRVSIRHPLASHSDGRCKLIFGALAVSEPSNLSLTPVFPSIASNPLVRHLKQAKVARSQSIIAKPSKTETRLSS